MAENTDTAYIPIFPGNLPDTCVSRIPRRRVKALRAAASAINRHLLQIDCLARRARISAKACSAPYKAKEPVILLDRCSRLMRPDRTLKQVSRRKCRV